MHTPSITSDRNVHRVDGREVRIWADPNSVLNDPATTLAEKRALLASWASDARAVANHPQLRQLDDGAFVTIDDVLDALKRLDALEGRSRPQQLSEWRRKGSWSRHGQRRYGPDDDDDDPLSPAPAMRPPRLPSLDNAAAAAA